MICLDATIADTISQEMKDSFPSCLVISDPSNNDEPTQETYACCDREQECGPDSDAPLSPVSAPNKKRNWVRLATLVLLEPGSLREAIGLVNNQAKHTQCFLSIWDPNRLEDGVGSAVNQTRIYSPSFWIEGTDHQIQFPMANLDKDSYRLGAGTILGEMVDSWLNTGKGAIKTEPYGEIMAGIWEGKIKHGQELASMLKSSNSKSPVPHPLQRANWLRCMSSVTIPARGTLLVETKPDWPPGTYQTSLLYDTYTEAGQPDVHMQSLTLNAQEQQPCQGGTCIKLTAHNKSDLLLSLPEGMVLGSLIGEGQGRFHGRPTQINQIETTSRDGEDRSDQRGGTEAKHVIYLSNEKASPVKNWSHRRGNPLRCQTETL